MMDGLKPLLASAFLRYSPDGASGGAAPPAEPKPEDATGGDKDEKKFSTAEVNAIVQERLERERKQQERAKAESEAQASEAAKAESARKLADEKRFEELVAVKQAEIDDLAAKVKTGESVAEKLARLEAVLTARRDAECGELPDEVTELLAGKDIAEQIEWLTKYGAKFAARTEEEPPADGGKSGGGTPRPRRGKPADGALTVAEIAARKRASGDYQ